MATEDGSSFWKVISLLGACGGIFSIFNFWYSSRERLSFSRDSNIFNDDNKFYGPLFPGECLEFNYIYFTLSLFNERKKILIKELKCSIFNSVDQSWVKCEMLWTPPESSESDISFGRMPGPFPPKIPLLFYSGSRELPSMYSDIYFIALRCPGFQTHDATFGGALSFRVKLELTTSRGNKFPYETKVWQVDPSKIRTKEIVEL